MALSIGTQLGSHEIIGLLGKGGMGEVYRARDLKLKREVAIKVLPEEFSRDADRVSRFQREAEVLASLNHPNIAAIHEFEETQGTRYLVLELVEGETLAERIARGPVPLDEVLAIAKQICDALQAAHDRGIIHRDLKPANIKLAPGGKVKVLDFGLAKALTDASGNTTLSNSPTLVSGSLGGVIIGTAAYMSPEQARGMEVDPRTDIWAFGCVLYEILTSKPAFTGTTAADIIAKIIERQPNWSLLPPDTPSLVRTLLSSALTKDRTKRLQHIDDAQLFLQPGEVPISPVAPVHASRWRFAAAAALAFALGASVLAGLSFIRTPAELPVMRFEIPAPEFLGGLAISPDGQRIAYIVVNGRQQTIWIRAIGSVTAQQLAETEGAQGLFWAPDSHRLAFFANQTLKEIDISAGGVQTLLGDAQVLGGTWTRDGMILLGGLSGKPGIYRMPESGGESVLATDPSSLSPFQIFPWSLPDGRHFLFHTVNPQGEGNLYFGSQDSKSTSHVIAIPNLTAAGINSAAIYAQGYLLFARDGTLLAHPFDPVHGTLSGEPTPVAQNVSRDFSASETGILVYHAAGQAAQTGPSHLSLLDRKGAAVGEVGTPVRVGSLNLSRNDGRIAIDDFVHVGATKLWVIDARGVPNPLTTDIPSFNAFPILSPDDSQVVFSSNRQNEATLRLYQKSSNGVGPAERLYAGDDRIADFPEDWSKEGIVFGRFNPLTSGHLTSGFLPCRTKNRSRLCRTDTATFKPKCLPMDDTSHTPRTSPANIRLSSSPSRALGTKRRSA
jgi:hypothetical protein